LDFYDVYISEVVITEISKTKEESKKTKLFEAINKYNLLVYNKLTIVLRI
jgi:hypothetical protein